MDKPCVHCGQPMVNRITAKARFCSADCRRTFHYDLLRAGVVAARLPRTCRQCGEPIAADTNGNVRFCCSACAKAFNRQAIEARRAAAIKDRRSKREPCRRCGQPIPFDRRSGSVYCSNECRDQRNQTDWRARSSGYMRQYLYGISPEEFEATFTAQGRRCAVCRADTPGGKGWHVDHDHATKAFRGILCHNCNLALGHFQDDPARLRAAVAYLER